MEQLLREILVELQSLNAKIETISDKLPLTAPLYGFDDIFSRIGEAAEEITGPTGYHLGDIHSQLLSLETAIDSK